MKATIFMVIACVCVLLYSFNKKQSKTSPLKTAYYMIVESTNKKNFEETVASNLNNGYRLAGGVSTSDGKYAQAMFKED